MTSAVRNALAAVKLASALLARGGVTLDERTAILAQLNAAVRVLEQSAGALRPTTAALGRRVAELEERLASMPPAARREAICTRLGISRASFYRLRRAVSPTRDSPRG